MKIKFHSKHPRLKESEKKRDAKTTLAFIKV